MNRQQIIKIIVSVLIAALTALEAGFKAQSKYTSLFGYAVAQKYVKPNYGE